MHGHYHRRFIERKRDKAIRKGWVVRALSNGQINTFAGFDLHRTVLSVSYVGSRGYNLLVQNDLNPEIPTIVNGQPTFPAGSPRKNPNLGAIAFNVPDGSSWYNSLQIYLTRNVGKDLQFQTSYTYSKSIDYGSISYGLEAGNSGQQAQSNPYDITRDKGVSDFDVRHNFVANAIYRLPFRGNRLVEGWQLSGIATARTGSPFSVQDAVQAPESGRILDHVRMG